MSGIYMEGGIGTWDWAYFWGLVPGMSVKEGEGFI